MREYVLEMKNIHKQFPGVYALQDVTLELKKGEVLALLGENGAGKSTLMKILSGVYKYDQGEIMINGRKCDINSPNDSKNLGIGTIYQELCLVPYMTIAENFFLGIEQIDRKTRRLKIKEMVSKTKDILKSLDLDIDPTQSISSLSIAQQQMVEIARAVSFNAEIIIMDEPTSSLTSKEVEKLFELIGKLKKNGISIIYISHRMEEIFRITDRVTVMRDGKNVGTKATDETNQDELISMMVGRVVEQYYTKENHVQDQKVLEVKDIVTQYSNHKLSFDLYKGEILGLTGLVGAGRTETVRVIFGIDPIKQGRIFLEGVEVKIRSPLDAMRMGIGLVPEDRKKEGLILSNGVGFNLTLLVLRQFMKIFKYNRTDEKQIIMDYKNALNVIAFSESQRVSNLSGGNQQKIVIAKWLATRPKVLILDEPTRGIDVGAKAEIYAIMNELTREGVSIIMISSELPEIMNMSDRIAVLSQGKITAILNKDEFNQENIMKHSILS